MGKRVSFVIASILLAGCSIWPGQKVKSEPVSFTHPDEVIKGEGFMALTDRRVFAVMAFLNATGYDEETKGQQMHPVRVKVREMMAANLAEHPKKLKAWRKYRNSFVRKYMETYNFQDFALSLNTDYPFRRIRPNEELGYSYTSWILADFPDVLNDFWATAKLGEIWEQVRPEYIAEIRKYDFEKMKRQMDFLWSYLRMERRDTLTLVNVPDPLDTHFHAIGAGYEGYYCSVESPGAYAYDLNAHEYLHSIVNDLVKTNVKAQKAKLLKYYRAGKDEPLCKAYQSPVGFTSESLVRALDHRLAVLQTDDPAEKKRIEGQVAWETEKGLLLVRPFYNLLAEYEQNDKPFDQFLPTLLERLPVHSR